MPQGFGRAKKRRQRLEARKDFLNELNLRASKRVHRASACPLSGNNGEAATFCKMSKAKRTGLGSLSQGNRENGSGHSFTCLLNYAREEARDQTLWLNLRTDEFP
jgi:hypothetical protein